MSVDAWGEVARAYRDYWSPRFQPFIDDALAAFEPVPQGPLVVPGCGPGLEALALAQRFPERDVIASDPSEPMVALSQTASEAAARLRVVRGSADEVSSLSLSVGGIVSSFSFQLLPDQRAVLEDWARCLGPNAQAVVLFWPRQPEGTAWRRLGSAVEVETQTWRSDWEPDLRAALPEIGLRIAREETLTHEIRYASPEEAWDRLVNAGSLQALKQRLSSEALARVRSAWLSDHGLEAHDGEWRHRPEARLWVLQRTITHAEFVSLETMGALRALYTERGVDTETRKPKWTERAQLDWHRAALAQARLVTEAPEALAPTEVQRGGVTFRIYGLWHGLIGGKDKAYKAFVDGTLASLEQTVFENGLHYWYPKTRYVLITDYQILGFLGSVRMGLEVGFIFPILIYELLGELFKVGRSTAPESYDYSPTFHAVDIETRRGLEPWPPLPSRLQIDYELEEWDRKGAFAGWSAPYAIAPRSMFMAGFACGHAEAQGLETVNLVVGDLHVAEIQRFLEDPGLAHPVFELGVRRGRRANTSPFPLDKILHLCVAASAGATILVSALYLLLFVIRALTGWNVPLPFGW